MGTVVQILADARLITLSEDTAEVAHEALIREWPTLRAWLDEDREGLRLHQHLAESAQEWERLSRDPDALYRGARLVHAREWADAHPGALIPLERSFLEAGLTQVERAEAEGRRAEEQQQAGRRLRRRAMYLSAALVFALGMAGLAVLFGDQARQNAASAQTSADVAFARELAAAAVGNLEVDPERSVLLALQAVATARADAPAALRERRKPSIARWSHREFSSRFAGTRPVCSRSRSARTAAIWPASTRTVRRRSGLQPPARNV
jgi:flagellar basal body-associated protein FliL